MIIKSKIKDFVVFTNENNSKYINVLNDFLSYDMKVIKIFRSIDDTKVFLIDTDYGKLILKVFSPKVKKTERFFKSLIKGDYYERLFSQTEKVRSEGLHSLNDFYLLAERKTLRFVHTYIMIIEYIDGVELSDMEDIDDELRNKIKESIKSLHQHGMVSGDPHRGNFIIENNKVRIIDLSGKRASASRKAKDRVDLERHYNIPNDIKDFGYLMLMYRKKIRALMRRLKGKPVR
ncbi:lipopolysaccharide core heptose(II) kinase RfaY [Citrobacter rodentium]|uniref:Lipopolysaccharide core biosynthesis protein n=2 Tax=Citrobacter rodentium TaxID=67825 RepID=D2TIX8_CITRI|nr:lipopolysaccharide core heptose(II) kinase RfaY [Citrobacter rodentium]KIQ50539.1 heptose kinase [Citrobacter rodentium]QBY30480.1 lipopolysaccharide core heptose(II) kinase RfaY [Citrobacter rodentium]UHO32149.1 lipopolysaccharide core heptose(II) kinase RfaY [Citrobacter rodentium NBRC 105723 = DSM 16636]CBG90890.1 lipopolysaccharide core biosynthesis protein [Citrobacter rodentium ICC168]HAT8013122.1 heptose kinase [Citrobacter rodentium NBRC 105723 = DSM 16636]